MEPWIAGHFSRLTPIPRLLCCSLEHSLADIAKWTDPLSNEQLWTPQANVGTVGFQLRHISGSVDRLLTYARKETLSPEQLAVLHEESQPGATKSELLEAVAAAYAAATRFAESATGL